MGKRAWGIPPNLELFIYDREDLVVPRGYLNEILLLIKGSETKVIRKQTEGKEVDFGLWNESFILRDYQKPMVNMLQNNNGIGVAPAGSGKTVMGLRYIFEKGVSAVWLTHTVDLLNQTKKNAEKLLTGVGKIGQFGGGKQDWGDGKLIVATVQTLQANPHLIEAMNEFVGTVVIDEAHHFPSTQFVDTAGLFKAKNMIGLTATPNRKDGLDMYMYRGVGPLVHQVSRDNLYDEGSLILPKVEFVYTNFDYEYASDRNAIDSVDAGGDDLDYSELLQRLIADEDRAMLIANNIVENIHLGPAIVIGESVRYCYLLESLCRMIYQNKYSKPFKSAVVHGGITRTKWVTKRPPEDLILEEKKSAAGMRYKVENYTEEEFKAWQVSKKQREEIMEKANNKEIDVLFATQLAREGLDMPHLTVGHMVMPKRGDDGKSKNGSAVEQEIGRIMRRDPNNPNKQATWFDYVDHKVGVLNSQYYSRRKVYKRLGIKLKAKPRRDQDEIADFLSKTNLFI
ncbi:DEAD/DEAH box helicase [Ornithinibacillus sp. JPR2-1]|uniref:DEAD/DEAH box helicase n=1 Tax=Ornithinibacillus sp. JPR2-1 TaxID=2094019 RepID=UPI0031D00D64